MPRAQGRALVPAAKQASAAGALHRWAAGLVTGIARLARPSAQLSMADPAWRAILEAGGYGGQPFLPSQAGVTVTPDLAMQIATVAGCCRIISETVAMLPLRLWERTDGGVRIAEGHPVDNMLWLEPNGCQTPYEFKSYIALSMARYGNAYCFNVRDRRGRVVGMEPLRPHAMSVRQVRDLAAEYRYTHYEGAQEVFNTGDGQLAHFRSMVTDGVRGLSPIQAGRNTLGLEIQQQAHASRLFTQGATPIGVIETDRKLGAEAIKFLREQFEETYSGVANAHRTLVLEDGLKWSKAGLNLEELEFLASRKFNRTEIAMLFGVPPHMIGDVEKSTSWGSGIEQQGIGFLIYTMSPWLARICQTIDRACLSLEERRYYFTQFDTEPITKGDLASRTKVYMEMVREGILNRNEARKALNYNPSAQAGADVLTVSTNTVYLDSPQVREGINRTAQAIAQQMPQKD